MRVNARSAVLFLVFLFFSTDGYGQSGYDLEVEQYSFKPRNGRSVRAELGTFYVQENRKTNSSKRIKLAYVLFKSTNPSPGAPIVYLAGGPGGSGISTARGSRYELFMAMREIGDVIAFDQRGTGLSDRLPGAPDEWSFPHNEAATREGLQEVVTEYAMEMAAYWREKNIDLSAYNTVESANDLEALRQVLGAEKISLWSISYGTHLALATLKQHPESIDQVILAGVEGLDQTVKLPSQQQDLLNEIGDWIKSDEVGSRAFPDFDLMSAIKTVLDRVEAQPVTIRRWFGIGPKFVISKFGELYTVLPRKLPEQVFSA